MAVARQLIGSAVDTVRICRPCMCIKIYGAAQCVSQNHTILNCAIKIITEISKFNNIVTTYNTSTYLSIRKPDMVIDCYLQNKPFWMKVKQKRYE